MLTRSFIAGLALTFLSGSSFAATEITWWHAMGGELGKKLDEIVAKYNASQSDYKVTAVYKGSYPETMTAAIAAFRAKQQPDIVPVPTSNTCTMSGCCLARKAAMAAVIVSG